MADEEQKKGTPPDFRVVQPERKEDGTTNYKSVGGLWKQKSKDGNEYYNLAIGNLRLLVFRNEPRS
jgi:hypothetical protein